jgi:hypothetical protein
MKYLKHINFDNYEFGDENPYIYVLRIYDNKTYDIIQTNNELEHIVIGYQRYTIIKNRNDVNDYPYHTPLYISNEILNNIKNIGYHIINKNVYFTYITSELFKKIKQNLINKIISSIKINYERLLSNNESLKKTSDKRKHYLDKFNYNTFLLDQLFDNDDEEEERDIDTMKYYAVRIDGFNIKIVNLSLVEYQYNIYQLRYYYSSTKYYTLIYNVQHFFNSKTIIKHAYPNYIYFLIFNNYSNKNDIKQLLKRKITGLKVKNTNLSKNINKNIFSIKNVINKKYDMIDYINKIKYNDIKKYII